MAVTMGEAIGIATATATAAAAVQHNVEPALSHGAEVWAIQFIAAAVAGCPRGSVHATGSAAKTLHMGTSAELRRLLVLRHATSNGAVLLETGKLPLRVYWLQRAGHLWNRLTAAPQGSLLHVVFCCLPPAHSDSSSKPAAGAAAIGRATSGSPCGHWLAHGHAGAPPATRKPGAALAAWSGAALGRDTCGSR